MSLSNAEDFFSLFWGHKYSSQIFQGSSVRHLASKHILSSYRYKKCIPFNRFTFLIHFLVQNSLQYTIACSNMKFYERSRQCVTCLLVVLLMMRLCFCLQFFVIWAQSRFACKIFS